MRPPVGRATASLVALAVIRFDLLLAPSALMAIHDLVAEDVPGLTTVQ